MYEEVWLAKIILKL